MCVIQFLQNVYVPTTKNDLFGTEFQQNSHKFRNWYFSDFSAKEWFLKLVNIGFLFMRIPLLVCTLL